MKIELTADNKTKQYGIIIERTHSKKRGRKTKIRIKVGEGLVTSSYSRPHNLKEKYSYDTRNSVYEPIIVDSREDNNKRVSDDSIRECMVATGRWLSVDSDEMEHILGTDDGATEFIQPNFPYETVAEVIEKFKADWLAAITNVEATIVVNYENALTVKEMRSLDKSVVKPVPVNRYFKRYIQRIINRVKKSNLNICIQSLKLAEYLYDELEKLGKKVYITILYNKYDMNRNKSSYDELVEINQEENSINFIYCSTDKEMTKYYMNTIKDFDLIIGNPPYGNTLHGVILEAVQANNPTSELVWLAPDNLCDTNARDVFSRVRAKVEPYFNGYEYVGNKFGDIELRGVNLAIYNFNFDSINEDHLLFNDARFIGKDNRAFKLQEVIKSLPESSFLVIGSSLREMQDPDTKKAIGAKEKNLSLKQQACDFMNKLNVQGKLLIRAALGKLSIGLQDEFLFTEVTIKNYAGGRSINYIENVFTEEQKTKLIADANNNKLWQAYARFAAQKDNFCKESKIIIDPCSIEALRPYDEYILENYGK